MMRKIILLSLSVFTGILYAQITVADGTQTDHRTPIYPYYGYSYSQIIYAASELNAQPGNITAIKYYYNPSATYNNCDGDLTVWIGHTTKNEFTGSTDWIDISTLTQVFSGSVNFDGSGELTITLSTPFAYDGASNLVVAVDENESGYDTSSSYFYGGDLGGYERRIYTRHDTNNPDPASPPAGTTGYTGAKITFIGLTQATCAAPSGLNAQSTSNTEAQLLWTENGTANAWEIEWGPYGFAQGNGTVVQTTYNPHTLTGLSQGGVYEFYVRSHCGGGDYSGWAGPFAWAQPPVNDDCSQSITLPVYQAGAGSGNEQYFSTANATSSSMSQTSCDNVGNNLDLFFTFTAPSNGNLKVITNGPSGNEVEAAVYDACNNAALVCFDRSNEKIITSLTPGNTYILQIYHDDTQAGIFGIVLEEGPDAPSNDECFNATEITSLPYNNTQDASTATNSRFVDCNGNGMNDGVWYTFVTGNTGGDITIQVSPQNWDAEVAVYTGDCNNLSCVQAVDDGVVGATETLTFTSNPNTTYYVNVGSYDEFTDRQEGVYTINITGNVTLSGSNIKQSTFDIFPNPAQSYISWNASYDVKSISIFDISGKLILKTSPTGNRLDISQLHRGVYMLHFQTDKKQFTLKLMVK